MFQAPIFEDVTTSFAGGGCTTTSSFHPDNWVETIVPPEAVEVLVNGSDEPLAEMVRVFESFGTESAAGVVHFRT